MCEQFMHQSGWKDGFNMFIKTHKEQRTVCKILHALPLSRKHYWSVNIILNVITFNDSFHRAPHFRWLEMSSISQKDLAKMVDEEEEEETSDSFLHRLQNMDVDKRRLQRRSGLSCDNNYYFRVIIKTVPNEEEEEEEEVAGYWNTQWMAVMQLDVGCHAPINRTKKNKKKTIGQWRSCNLDEWRRGGPLWQTKRLKDIYLIAPLIYFPPTYMSLFAMVQILNNLILK